MKKNGGRSSTAGGAIVAALISFLGEANLSLRYMLNPFVSARPWDSQALPLITDTGTGFYETRSNGGDVNSVFFEVTSVTPAAAVPEPSTYALLAAGAVALGWARRIRRVAGPVA